MDFSDRLQALAAKIEKQRDKIKTEEATKNAFVMPFISALDYDIFDPSEVIPEYTADHGIKKGEKVDYAIMKNGKPIMLFECKNINSNLDEENISQLYRYFSVTDVRIGVLTNGTIYRFFTDLEEPNKMDTKPFLEIELTKLNDTLISELKKFTKVSFDTVRMISSASELKYSKEIKHILADQLNSPSNDFVTFFASQVYSGRLTQKIREKFTDITKRALNSFINDRINERLKSALTDNDKPTESDKNNLDDLKILDDNSNADRDSRIITTEEELEGFYIVKSMLRETIDIKRVTYRDSITYFAILFDDNNRKTICRLHFNASQKYIGLIDENKKEKKMKISSLDDLYQYADNIKKTVLFYTG